MFFVGNIVADQLDRTAENVARKKGHNLFMADADRASPRSSSNAQSSLFCASITRILAGFLPHKFFLSAKGYPSLFPTIVAILSLNFSWTQGCRNCGFLRLACITGCSLLPQRRYFHGRHQTYPSRSWSECCCSQLSRCPHGSWFSCWSGQHWAPSGFW